MSACISREGEYSEHVWVGDGFTCSRCFVFDEDGAISRIRALEAAIARVHAAKREVPMPRCAHDGQIVRQLLIDINAALNEASK